MATARRKKATRKPAKKAARKPGRKPARKAAKKPARKPAKKAARSTSRAARGRTARRATTARKPARKAARKPARKAPAPKAPPPPSNPVNWFEIPVADMARAQGFYERVLQMKLSLQDMGTFKMAWFTGFPNGLGASGTLMQSSGYTPSHAGSMVYFSVKDIESTLARVVSNGGQVVNPKMAVGQHGFVAHFQDSEGNRVALHAMS